MSISEHVPLHQLTTLILPTEIFCFFLNLKILPSSCLSSVSAEPEISRPESRDKQEHLQIQDQPKISDCQWKPLTWSTTPNSQIIRNLKPLVTWADLRFTRRTKHTCNSVLPVNIDENMYGLNMICTASGAGYNSYNITCLEESTLHHVT